MTDRPSDGMTLEELREELDWISEFQSRMAERIRGDADVHNLVDYVRKLESENTKLRELVKSMHYDLTHVTFPRRWLVDYEADMRELGMEVDDVLRTE